MKQRLIKTSVFFLSLVAVIAAGCKFAASFDKVDAVYADSASFDKTELVLETGATEMLSLSVTPDSVQQYQSVSVSYSYNTDLLSNVTYDNYSFMFTAVKAGTAYIEAQVAGATARCKVQITGVDRPVIPYPYIYASKDYIRLTPDETQTIVASLAGGTPGDSMAYTWSIDKPAVAQIQGEGNACRVTGISAGIAKITVRHEKALYGYSILVNVSSDGQAVPYLTTEQNVVSIHKSENPKATIAVSLKNPDSPIADTESGFTYTIADAEGQVIACAPFSIEPNGRTCTITALERGTALLRVTHAAAPYSLDILVVVTEIIDNAYIEVDKSYVTVTGDAAAVVTASITNASLDAYKRDDFIYTFSSGAENYIDYSVFGGEQEDDGKGDQIIISGKKTGQVKLTISHPACSASRSVTITIKDITAESSSADTYITTSQNYIRTAVGNESTPVTLIVKNADASTKDLLKWEIQNIAADGSDAPVIELESYDGSVSLLPSRAASAQTFFAQAKIKPLAVGQAVISVSHPDGIYATDIIVKVLDKGSSGDAEKTLILSAQSTFYTIQNGTTLDTSVLISGTDLATDEDTKIRWTSSSNDITVSASGVDAVITAPPSGSGRKEAVITVSHPDADYPVNITVVSYDDETDLEGYRYLYTDTPYISLKPKEYANVQVHGAGYSEAELETLRWDVEPESPFTFSTVDTALALIEGSEVGVGTITALLGTQKVVITVTVLPEEITLPENPQYLTTAQNVVTLDAVDDTAEITVSAIGIQGAEGTLRWDVADSSIADITPAGLVCHVTAKAVGKTTITVSHPESENALSIVVHVGDTHQYHNEDIGYIALSHQSIELEKDGANAVFYARLSHTETDEIAESGFTFKIQDSQIARITPAATGNSCIVTPVSFGQTVIEVHHPDARYPAELIVAVNDSSQGEPVPYLTTEQNVISVLSSDMVSAQVKLINASSYGASGWNWVSAEPAIVDVVANNGDTALLAGNEPGTTVITVSHEAAPQTLELIVTCIDSAIAQAAPWINVSTNIVHLAKNSSCTLTAEMVGGSETSQNAFLWSSSSPQQVYLQGSGSAAEVTGLSKGISYISVRNSEYPDAYTKTIQVIVEEDVEEGYAISVPEKIYRLDPTSTESTTIVAELVNGDDADNADFVWWADDYSLFDLNAVNNEALITPTGVSGQTYIHIEHKKVLMPTDILVLVSEYDTFAFSQTSKKINEGNIAFVEMEVPLTGGETWIEYSSSAPEICAVTGNTSVCMIAGLKDGSATVRASLMSDAGRIAQSDMAVIVNNVEEGDPVIDVASTLITLDLHESQIVRASISGEQISESESHELIWETSNPDVVSLLQTETNISKGNSAHLTAKKAGEAVITVSHPDYDVSVDIWVKVPDVQELDISLSQVYMELFKDDGSVTIEAMVTNGTSDDYNNITWSAAKVGGVNIVSISNQAQGRTCNIVPRNPGQTTVRAQLPNGKYADCIVVVNDAAEILLSTKAVHVNPGYSETVSYTLNPPDAKVEWLALASSSGGSFGEDASQFFTFTVNEAAQTITINGIREGTGSIQGFFSSTSGETASITVYVEYNYDVNFDTSVVSCEPTKDITVPFDVFPFDLEVEVKIKPDNANLVVKEIQHDKATGKGNIILTPLGEQKDIRVQFSATNPNDKVNTPIIREKTVHLYYNDYTITPRFHYRSGSFSRYDETNNMLYLGDGEEYVFYLDIAEELADIENLKVSYAPATSNADKNYQLAANVSGGLIVFEEDDKGEEDGERRWRIKHTNDVVQKEFWLLNKELQFKYTKEEYRLEPIYRNLLCGETYTKITTDAYGDPQTTTATALCANAYKYPYSSKVYHRGACLTETTVKLIDHYEEKKEVTASDILTTRTPNEAIVSWYEDRDSNLVGQWNGEAILPFAKKYSDAFRIFGMSYTKASKQYFDILYWHGSPDPHYQKIQKITKKAQSVYSAVWWAVNPDGSENDTPAYVYNIGKPTYSPASTVETLEPVYVSINPMVISDSVFKANPNYYLPPGTLKRGTGLGSDSESYNYSEKILHAYAERTVTKDTSLAAAQPQGQGQIIVTYNAVGSSTEITKRIPVTVEVRNCEYHCETDWKAYTDSDGNKYWKRG